VKERRLAIDQNRPFKLVLAYLLLAPLFPLNLARAEAAKTVFDRIARSLPDREAGWSLAEADGPHVLQNGTKEMNFTWVRHAESVNASVLVFRNARAVRRQPSGPPQKDEVPMKGFLIDGIGDEAYLFPPIIQGQPGPYNLSLRKKRCIVSVATWSKDTILRCAAFISDAVR
jgi:hypothetical protein